MKRVCCLLGLVLLLTGCAGENRELARAMELRNAVLSSKNCSFLANITADYGDSLYEFSMDCEKTAEGALDFEILKPKSIAGIRGTLSDSGGSIVFEENAVYFPMLSEELLTPAAAPWVLLKSLEGGYIRSVCLEDPLLHITVDETYGETALTLDIWVDEENKPVRSDILENGRRILSLEVESFSGV